MVGVLSIVGRGGRRDALPPLRTPSGLSSPRGEEPQDLVDVLLLRSAAKLGVVVGLSPVTDGGDADVGQMVSEVALPKPADGLHLSHRCLEQRRTQFPKMWACLSRFDELARAEMHGIQIACHEQLGCLVVKGRPRQNLHLDIPLKMQGWFALSVDNRSSIHEIKPKVKTFSAIDIAILCYII